MTTAKEGTRVCKVCAETKPLDRFAQNKVVVCRVYRSRTCRDCTNALKREQSPAKRVHLRQKVWAYLAKHPCVDCGLDDPVVLQFDHREPEMKHFNIGDSIGRRLGWIRILAEMLKCDVRCANCHQKRTAAQFGWYEGVAVAS